MGKLPFINSHRQIAAAGIFACLFCSPAAQAQNLVDTIWNLRPISQAAHRETYREMDLVGMNLPPASNYDIPLAEPKATVEKIKSAMDRVLRLSPVSAAGIATLKKYGRVRVVYDAAFPERQLSRIVIAAYLVGEFQPQNGRRDFTVVVGRFGANWPVDELAAVLVHELIGHGVQRLKNRFGQDRPIDLECEARLWQQLYFTDAGMAQDTREMVDFRNTTDRRVCHDFRRYLAHSQPNLMRKWDSGTFSMAEVLKQFPPYYQTIRNGLKKLKKRK